MAWSPSSVRDFQLCPRLWWLKRQRVSARVSTVWSPGIIAGVAFHKGMEAFVCGEGDDEGVAEAVQKALELGDYPIGTDYEEREKIQYAVTRAVPLAHLEIGVKSMGGVEHVLGCEVHLGGSLEEAARHGRYAGTADLITEDDDGLIVTDYKTHWKRDAKYADEELRETQRSWQLKQYAWFAQEKYQKTVKRVRKVLVYFTPALKVWSYTHTLQPMELANWYEQARSLWMSMDAYTERDTYRIPYNGDACERYGWQWRCGFYSVCWDGDTIQTGGSNETV